MINAPAPNPRETSPAPQTARRTPILDMWQTHQELFEVSKAWCLSDAEHVEAVIEPADRMRDEILVHPITCPADLAAQIPAATENGGFELSAEMLDRLRAMVSEEAPQ